MDDMTKEELMAIAEEAVKTYLENAIFETRIVYQNIPYESIKQELLNNYSRN